MLTNTDSPAVSVILSVYNGAEYLQQAITSILQQTFADFEFIIINDGSTDATASIIKSFSDERIRLITHHINLGLTKSLKEGVLLAKGDLIARMDADDISLPDRLSKQVEFLHHNPEIGLVGTGMYQMDEHGRLLQVITPPSNPFVIAWKSCFECTIMHSTVLMRRKVVLGAGNYSPDYPHVEDTELWKRMLSITRFANLAEPLYQRRWHRQSISYRHADWQRQQDGYIRKELLEKLIGTPIPSALKLYYNCLVHPIATLSARDIKLVINALEITQQKFIETTIPSLDPIALNELHQDLYLRIEDIKQRNVYYWWKTIYRWLKYKTPRAIKTWIQHQRYIRQRNNSILYPPKLN